MRRIVNRDGEVAELYGPDEDIPQHYVNEDRRAARLERKAFVEKTERNAREARLAAWMAQPARRADDDGTEAVA